MENIIKMPNTSFSMVDSHRSVTCLNQVSLVQCYLVRPRSKLITILSGLGFLQNLLIADDLISFYLIRLHRESTRVVLLCVLYIFYMLYHDKANRYWQRHSSIQLKLCAEKECIQSEHWYLSFMHYSRV